jgi:hypothetical protein
MANDWASRESAKDLTSGQGELLRLEKESRDHAMMDERGPALFAELYEYIVSQVDSYNERMGSKIMDVSLSRVKFGSSQSFKVLRMDGTKQPLELTYNPASHRIRCECGAGPQEFILKIGPDGEARFETPYHQAFSIKDLGDKILDHWKSSPI